MTKHSFSIKTLFFAIIIGLSLLFGSNAWAFGSILTNHSNHSTSLFADTATSTETVDGFANSDFESPNSTASQPITPSSWTVANDASDTKSQQKSGLITLDTASFDKNKENLGLTDYSKPPLLNANNPSNKVLMINSNGTPVCYGYESTSIDLDANSYYQIQASVYLDSATASLYLVGEDFDNLETSKVSVYQSTGNKVWRTVTFYISTSIVKNSSVKMQLFLGKKAHGSDTSVTTSGGFVLFDDIKVTKLSGAKFEDSKAINEFSTTIDLNQDVTKITSGAGFVQNGDFTNGSSNWTESKTNSNGNTLYTNDLNIVQNINDNDVIFGTHQGTTNNSYGVILSAKNGNVEIKSSDITIKRHQIYKISFWAKGSLNSGSLNFTLGGILPETAEETTQSQTISGLSTSTKALNGNWGLYEFYVVGHPLSDATINLTLGIGSTTAKATGYVAVTDIQSYLITTEQMTSGTALNDNAKTLNMFNSSTLTFSNYTFNLVNVDKAQENISYPLEPQNWTAQNTNNTKSGVVNISPDIWQSQSNLNKIARPSGKSQTDDDNVLMLNVENSYQAYKSETTSISSDSYNKISFQVNIKSITGNAYVTIKNSNDVVLAKVKLSDTTSGWENYSIYLHNYLMEQTISATLGLGTENEKATGYVYFDNCKISTDLTEDDFKGVTANQNNIVIDLSSNWLSASNEDSKPALWDLVTNQNDEGTSIKGGIVDVNDFENSIIRDANPGLPEGVTDSKILVIGCDSPIYAQYKSSLTYKFSSSTYYKVSVYVKTSNLTADDSEEYTEQGQKVLHGASVLITNIDQKFVSINTKNAQNENEWTNYIFYIYTTSDTTSNIQLGLGYTGMATAGYAYFSNLTVTKLSNDEYKNELLNYDENNLPNNVLLATNTPEDEDEPNPQSFGNIDPFAISTIIIAVAIIVAIVGVMVKKFYHARPKKAKVVNNNYDRLQTLLKDVDRRERKTAINHKIKLLQEELEQSKHFLEQEIAELGKQTNSFNTAKEIAKDNPNVKLETPDVKQIQKNIETQNAKIQQIELDISILEEEKERLNKQAKKSIEASANAPQTKSANLKKRK